MSPRPVTGLVLSGGGVRGAYEVGVISGIVEVLGLGPDDPSLFRIFSGTSVGAINAAFMVANAQRGDLNIGQLAEVYRQLSVAAHLKFVMRQHTAEADRGWTSRSFVDPRPLELLVRRTVNWDALHHNIASGAVRALIVAAFDLISGKTAIFAETSNPDQYHASLTAQTVSHRRAVSADHVLASAAIPLLFPARKIDGSYYCDGGVRFNTPISPAIRAGAERLVIVSVQSEVRAEPPPLAPDHNPSPLYVAGKLLNALLLDPFQYDLTVLQRLNRLMETLQKIVPASQYAELEQVMEQLRGMPYRKLDILVFTPSEDLGQIANDHLKRYLDSWGLGAVPRFLLRRAALDDATWEADWAAYLMFDGSYAGRLIELGLNDARARAQEIREFFRKH